MPPTSEVITPAVESYEAGRLVEAQDLCELALKSEPLNAGAWFLLALIAWKSGDLEKAVACSERAFDLSPAFPQEHCNLGYQLLNLGRVELAERAFRRVVGLVPQFAPAHDGLASTLKRQGRINEAISSYRSTLDIDPNSPETLTNLGLALVESDPAQAVDYCRSAVEFGPQFAQTHNNLGFVMTRNGQHEEAIASCRRALEINPNFADAFTNLGTAYLAFGMRDAAAKSFERAIALSPESAQARFNQSALLLLRGKFKDGWQQYEWRRRTGEAPPRDFVQPRWNGEPLEGKTVMIWAEQGLGDTLQFVRYAAMVKNLGARVVFECQKPLLKLIRSAKGIDCLVEQESGVEVSGQRSEVGEFDYQIPLLSLPGVFKTTLETIPAEVPYLFAEPALILKWRERLVHVEGFRIGINWQGRPGKGPWQARNIPVEMFESLAEIPGFQLVSLQKDAEPSLALRASEAVGKGQSAIIELGEFDTEHGAFIDTAAIMMNLDLVITSDTSVAHLAGALGVPVWVALPFVPDWRWLLDRSDSPWYPTMRLFRQKKLGDWAGVFEEIKAALAERVARSGDGPQP
jgi:Flp pilus assembly protein TadD